MHRKIKPALSGNRRSTFLRPWNLIALGTGLMAIALCVPDLISDAFGPAYTEKYFLITLWFMIAVEALVAWGCWLLAMQRSAAFAIVAGLLLASAGVLGFYGIDANKHGRGALWIWTSTWIFDGASMLLAGVFRLHFWQIVFSQRGRESRRL